MNRRSFIQKSSLLATTLFISLKAHSVSLFDLDNKISGTVTSLGKGINGVVVSDGFNVVQTDANGNYTIEVNPLAQFIWLSTPAGYEFKTESYIAKHYEQLQSKSALNFELKPLKRNDEKHAFIIWADPQVKNKKDVQKMMDTSVPDTKKIVKSFKKLNKSDNYERFILFLEIIKWLSNSEREQLSNHLYDKKITDNEGKRMQTVFEHVMTNYQKNINLDEIASIANMTKNAFCRYFKVRTNKSFFQFLIEVRIEHASKLLANNSELSVLEIAELCGFNNISNFNRKFKELKQTSPLQYRKLNL